VQLVGVDVGAHVRGLETLQVRQLDLPEWQSGN